MPTLLACTDGSLYARSVYDHAAWAAQRLNAEVHVLHMLEHPERVEQTDLSGAIGIDTQSQLLSDIVMVAESQGRIAQTRSRQILSEAHRVLTEAGIAKIVQEQRHGALVDALDRYEATADLVVVGKRGEHADFAKLHLGSNLERVIRTCRHPVLVASRAFKPMERFLIAYDSGASARKAIDYALQQPLLKGMGCHILSVGMATQEWKGEMAAMTKKLNQAGYVVSTECLPGDPETIIAEAVKRLNINLLVMGAYGHSKIRQFIVGSTTTTMVRTVQIPVLMFR